MTQFDDPYPKIPKLDSERAFELTSVSHESQTLERRLERPQQRFTIVRALLHGEPNLARPGLGAERLGNRFGATQRQRQE